MKYNISIRHSFIIVVEYKCKERILYFERYVVNKKS